MACFSMILKVAIACILLTFFKDFLPLTAALHNDSSVSWSLFVLWFLPLLAQWHNWTILAN